MKTKYLLFLCTTLLLFAACKKKEEAAKATVNPFAGTWVNAAEPRTIVVKPDGAWDECYGTGPDLAASGGITVQENTVINPQDNAVIYSNVQLSGDQLVVDGTTYTKGELSAECKDLMSLP